MALTYAELESVTRNYFLADKGKATDIYFKTSFLLEYLMKQKKGIWERPSGGDYIRIPLEYDGQESSFYEKGESLTSDDRVNVNVAKFAWRHAFGNATIYRIDTLKNAGKEADIKLAVQRIGSAQKSITALLAGSIYDLPGGDSKRLTGLRALMNETTTTKYGDIAEADLVANDGTYPWEGKMSADAATMDLALIRAGKRGSKVRDGVGGKANIVMTTETLRDTLEGILQAQQRFTNDTNKAVAGFDALHVSGVDIFADDYCPASHVLFLNTNHVGFAIHANGYFVREKWSKIPDSAGDRTMKILWDGNLICNNRKAFQGYSNVS
jgi:hypothetical protein